MADAAGARDWLPDFCRLPILFATLVAAQLVVVVIGLAPGEAPAWSGRQWLAASLLAQWLALSSAVVLCKLRGPLGRLRRGVGGLVAASVPVLVALVGSALVHELDVALGFRLSLPPALRNEFVLSATAIAGLVGAVLLRYFYVQQQWQQQIESQARAEVAALQARIQPHFLFNSMNSIAGLVRRDPATAERAIEDLAELFRAALGAGDAGSTLDEELRLTERYLAIESLRFGPRLAVEWALADDLPRDLALPRLTLQPLVENAIGHGIARLADGGRVRIEAMREGEGVRVRVGNPCPPNLDPDAGNRHAQASVRQRLTYAFGARARMTAQQRGGYYEVDLLLPLDR